MTERVTDFLIGDLLKQAGIKFTPDGGATKEISEALKTASKARTGRVGFPEFTAVINGFVLVIEDKKSIDLQAKYNDDSSLLLDNDSIKNYAENGAVHYAKHIVKNTPFDKIFAFGCSGNQKHHAIRPIFVDKSGNYTLLKEVDNFENFNTDNIERYYREQVLGETPIEIQELKYILDKSQELHEYLRNYASLGETEKPLVVSAILLALNENKDIDNQLTGDAIKTDGQKIFDAVASHMRRVEVEPQVKREKVLNQFNLIKDREVLSKVNTALGKTPLRYFTKFLKQHVLNHVVNNSPEDVLGRFYGEFMSYSGGDGKSLGVVLTPRHITEIFCELVEIKPTDKLFDPCCGTGGFLIAGMHHMLEKAKTEQKKEEIKKNQIYGIEKREDMFSIATTNMILRGDGKSNLICDDFLEQNTDDLKKKSFTVGFMNPPYSQAKGKDTAHLSEINFTKHLLDSMANEARVVVIVPQSTMVGKTKEDKLVKKDILKNHTLEGVITLNKNTFYRIGTNACLAIFTCHRPHPSEHYSKFINFDDDGFEVKKHIGLVETERAKEKKKHLLSCWLHNADAETKFMVKTKVNPDDEWLHSFYYFNNEIPTDVEFENTMANFLAFEFNMITHGKGYLFNPNDKQTAKKETSQLEDRVWKNFKINEIIDVFTGALLSKKDLRTGTIPRISASEIDNGVIGTFLKLDHKNYRELTNFISISFLGGVFYHPYTASLDMKIHAVKIKNYELNRYVGEFLVLILRKMAKIFSYGDQLSSTDLPKQTIILPTDKKNNPDWQFMEDYMKNHEQGLINEYRKYIEYGFRRKN